MKAMHAGSSSVTIGVAWLGRQEVQRGFYSLSRGPKMPMRTLLPATIAALLCISVQAGAQDNTPGGASKNVRVSFEEWTVPTARSFPHDPLAAADGSIWYTGQMASTLGRLDPKTGAFK
jgi:streptogramin lyase